MKRERRWEGKKEEQRKKMDYMEGKRKGREKGKGKGTIGVGGELWREMEGKGEGITMDVLE